MIETYIAIIGGYIAFTAWTCELAYKNWKLKVLVKQKEEEIEHMKRVQRVCGDY